MTETELCITMHQKKYLYAVEMGATNSQLLSDVLDISRDGVTRMMRKLEQKGIVVSTEIFGKGHGRGYHLAYRLVDDHKTKIAGARIRRAYRLAIPPCEIEYVAELRKANLTGQELVDMFQATYPHRTKAAIKNLISRAQRVKLCR